MMDTLKAAEKAISEFYGDVSNTPQQTKDGLEALRDHIDGMLDALAADGVE